MTPSDIRARVDSEHFFNRDTMQFFGDTMRSYGVRTIDGQRYMYRKPSAQVNVFGNWKRSGREFFGAWRVVENADGSISLDHCGREMAEMVYRKVA